MNPSLLTELQGITNLYKTSANGVVRGLDQKSEKAEGTMFEAFLNSALDNIQTTNAYLSDAENQEILFALGEADSTHDLTIALEKASTALQYTVAIRDKIMEAYKEIMQMQI
ncbi:MAG: flagellar hook-basal body complex protein FliE [Lachnospiraceae bacterium]|jgi:flagellar hook-basal body complex protein FliE|nr:flagellar hook-basal body complex protein FliE [Lachnospiraceae bacterium]